MRNNYRYSRYNRNVRIRRKRILILTIIIVALGGLATSIIDDKFFSKDKNVQALASNEAVVSKQDDGANKTKEDDTNAEVQSDSNVDDVASVEKFLTQQAKGQKIEDTDGKKVVYLSFDDGPSETNTPSILKTLKDENVKATFFVLGKAIDQSEANKNLLKQEVEEGHAIGNHSYSHNYKYLYPNGSVNTNNFMSEINKTNESLKKVLGEDFSTRAIRFPGGHMSWKNTGEVDKIMKEKDYHYVDWNALSKDAEGPHKNADQLTEEVKKTVGNKTKVVLLMHDTYGKEETAKALPGVIDYLKSQGYEFRTFK
ncbi:polysaccharide deacetylase family protein [Clostridium beijerinckii]|jgi:Predicted xylanase/chitin deacetylase|uniref:Polysaccharide deacetylase n=2 Tax=Clostridium beijerinckii TaxID=1520 RepID=A0AAE2RRF7_CLOBE|nr:polysaccharide deacetylase family protein [Clostridium beijerinckii]ABR35019.1 polysaccharide deacetylase [Clostridium beijerinckii NCIMB 8052]AIU03180.1 polysaccharide deacetylase [Clostridium beijerinckii ATCC 35702]MBF7810345.1 polysaccharide deacetylase [Clostridium beijerinckii]NRT23602.1 peptidoglycan/xylan/chitin deacetylase (PgdA/CDA1 family) [Clostridium beijerinckii]NRT68822.1 peptidoglycan/xylan/chitin deacetylase (PgdA/CDA1 family) [Clostridium beijerinckii]